MDTGCRRRCASGSLTGQRGAIDVGLLREADPRRGLQLETLLDEPVHAVRLAAHPLATRVALDLDLADEPFVLWRRSGSPGLLRPAHRRPPGPPDSPPESPRDARHPSPPRPRRRRPRRLTRRRLLHRLPRPRRALRPSHRAARHRPRPTRLVRHATRPPARPAHARGPGAHQPHGRTRVTPSRVSSRLALSRADHPARATDASTIIAGRNTRAPRPFLETPPSLSGASCPRSRSPSPSRY